MSGTDGYRYVRRGDPRHRLFPCDSNRDTRCDRKVYRRCPRRTIDTTARRPRSPRTDAGRSPYLPCTPPPSPSPPLASTTRRSAPAPRYGKSYTACKSAREQDPSSGSTRVPRPSPDARSPRRNIVRATARWRSRRPRSSCVRTSDARPSSHRRSKRAFSPRGRTWYRVGETSRARMRRRVVIDLDSRHLSATARTSARSVSHRTRARAEGCDEQESNDDCIKILAENAGSLRALRRSRRSEKVYLATWSPSLPLRAYEPSAAAPAFSSSAMYKSPISLSGSSDLPRQSSKSGI